MAQNRQAHQKASSPTAGKQAVAWGVLSAPFLVALAVLVVGAFSDSHFMWGFNFLSLIPIHWSLLFAATSGLLFLPPIARMCGRVVQRVHDRIAALNSRPANVSSAILISAALFAFFYIFRSQAPVYGDGYLILGSLSADSALPIEGKNALQALSLIVLRQWSSFFQSQWSIEPVVSVALFNAIGGVVGAWGIYRIAHTLASDWKMRLFLVAVSFTSGAVVLFFGYHETYPWGTALGLWTLYYSLEVVQGKKKVPHLIIISLLSLAYHAITLTIAVVALAALGASRSTERRLFGFMSFRNAMLAFGIVSVLIAVITQATGIFDAFGLSHPFVPIWGIPGNDYLAFSLSHLADMANLGLLLAPLGMILLAFGVTMKGDVSAGSDPKAQILGLAALLTSLASFWIDPELGAPRDWDLLSFPGIPLTLYGAYRFISHESVKLHARMLIVPTIVLAGLFVGPNIYEKTDLNIAVERLDRQLWEDAHYQKSYDQAKRGLSWGTTLLEGLQREDISAKYFFRRIEADPQSASAWFNLGQIYFARKQGDSAIVCLETAVRYNPESPRYLLKFAGALQLKNRFADALPVIAKCDTLDSDNATVQTNYGIILFRLGRDREALDRFNMAYRLSQGGAEEAANLGSAYYGTRALDSAVVYLSKAVVRGNTTPRVFESLILSQLELGLNSAAEATLAQYRSIHATARDMSHYRNELKEATD